MLYSMFSDRRAASSLESSLEVHLDPLGGLSGDMFVAALLDAFPEHWPHVQATISSLNLGLAAECQLVPHHDHSFAGSQFQVTAEKSSVNPSAGGPHAASPDSSHAHGGRGHYRGGFLHEAR